jgi:hypothetical protein
MTELESILLDISTLIERIRSITLNSDISIMFLSLFNAAMQKGFDFNSLELKENNEETIKELRIIKNYLMDVCKLQEELVSNLLNPEKYWEELSKASPEVISKTINRIKDKIPNS